MCTQAEGFEIQGLNQMSETVEKSIQGYFVPKVDSGWKCGKVDSGVLCAKCGGILGGSNMCTQAGNVSALWKCGGIVGLNLLP